MKSLTSLVVKGRGRIPFLPKVLLNIQTTWHLQVHIHFTFKREGIQPEKKAFQDYTFLIENNARVSQEHVFPIEVQETTGCSK